MVGIPGRSKGCVTCRKRKKGVRSSPARRLSVSDDYQCDAQQPACSQCLERNIECGGYDPDRVFITSKYVHSTSRANPPPVPHRDSMMDLLAVTASTYYVMPLSLAQTAFSMRGVEAAFGLFPVHKDTGGALKLVNRFSSMLAALSVQEEALRQTIFAVGMVTLGKGSKDQTVQHKGRALYGRALQELGLALQNPKRRTIEALLATTRLMGIYEILYGADGEDSTQARNWMSHAQGELALIVSRGPEAFTTDTAHLMFTLARYNNAISGVRSRRPAVFNEEQWKTIPWRGRFKSSSDTIIDILLEVPGILSELDYIDSLSPDDECFDDSRLRTIKKCWTAHCQLDTWFKNNSREVHIAETEAPVPIEFANFGVASLSVRYWAIATLLYQSLDRALRYSLHDDLAPYVNRLHGRSFARLILRSVSWLFRRDNGVAGASTMSFPLGVALMCLRQSDVPEPDYMKLVFSVWNDPEWPSSVRDFLRSMGNPISLPTRQLPENPITWSTRELKPIFDIHGDTITGPIQKQ
ncbi:uncharacterized protein EKO05_0006809 [Ascochyta rabiei]|uniref:uncharacterized protein n=1 Tax=Didymella rabiei TaxID=5454 RepID=UPI0021F9DBD9|nr:uncharacterized protein EKO05_0006809 [Ascochyta rabiei]UPX16407.1 hypothetical protein EKO05_0006809 [Ascochyta rabiei]